MMFVCIIVGIMLFYIELYVAIIYSETYIIIIRSLQVFLFTAFAQVIVNNLRILTQSTNNTKINAEIAIIQMVLTISITIIALLFYNFFLLIFYAAEASPHQTTIHTKKPAYHADGRFAV